MLLSIVCAPAHATPLSLVETVALTRLTPQKHALQGVSRRAVETLARYPVGAKANADPNTDSNAGTNADPGRIQVIQVVCTVTIRAFP